MKKYISLFIIVTLLMVSICSTYAGVGAISTAGDTSKIDSALLKVMENTGEKEKIPVAVWFKEIDFDSANEKIESKLKKQVENKKISDDTKNLFYLKTNNPEISKKG